MFVKVLFESPKYNSAKIGVVKIDDTGLLPVQIVDKAKEAVINKLNLNPDTTVFTSLEAFQEKDIFYIDYSI